ncbi:MAG: hypothetical protein DRZ90_08360 [Spirochaetes bacterium]|nr:MAG: hypothetical protein DRZ90_08360 [Spirochaetota bacterium]
MKTIRCGLQVPLLQTRNRLPVAPLLCSPEDLGLVDKSFISDELERREADLIFKVNRGGRSAYIYILMEFQSTPIRLSR